MRWLLRAVLWMAYKKIKQLTLSSDYLKQLVIELLELKVFSNLV